MNECKGWGVDGWYCGKQGASDVHYGGIKYDCVQCGQGWRERGWYCGCKWVNKKLLDDQNRIRKKENLPLIQAECKLNNHEASKTEKKESFDERTSLQNLLNFMDQTASRFHVICKCEAKLNLAGFKKLEEKKSWVDHIVQGGKYYISRNASLIAFIVPKNYLLGNGMNIVGAHTDFPGLLVRNFFSHFNGILIRYFR